MPMFKFLWFLFHKRILDAKSGLRIWSGSIWASSKNRLGCWTRLVTYLLLVIIAQPVFAAGGSQPFILHETFEQQNNQNQAENKTNHGIVGMEMLIQHGKFPVVQGVYPGTPAAVHGLLPGDQILAINGISTMGKTASEIDILISDVPGERVLFNIQRGMRQSQLRLTVVALDSLPALVRSDFSGLFNDYP